jgi:hypothetical protein
MRFLPGLILSLKTVCDELVVLRFGEPRARH